MDAGGVEGGELEAERLLVVWAHATEGGEGKPLEDHEAPRADVADLWQLRSRGAEGVVS